MTPEDRADAIVRALNDPNHVWTQAQVLDLVSLAIGQPGELDDAWRDGWEACERAYRGAANAAYPPPPWSDLAADTQQANQIRSYRRQMGVDRRYRRRTDHPGGPVEVW